VLSLRPSAPSAPSLPSPPSPALHSRAPAVKRAVDLVVSALALAAALPVLLIVSWLIYLEDGGPVLFRQRRVGLGGREFELLKFRTMRRCHPLTEATQEVGNDHPLLTRTGRVLRRFKLDELPQLINVLRDEMSLVGPRPTVPTQVVGYNAFQSRRLLVRPGMTGWAQVNGNVRLSWNERITLDVWYVDHWSLRLDARILARTLLVVLFGENPNDHALRQARLYANGSGRSG
jgi:lipopolysaccharide/colanic/teichoic acid biosynthesis glycosyltransferase